MNLKTWTSDTWTLLGAIILSVVWIVAFCNSAFGEEEPARVSREIRVQASRELRRAEIVDCVARTVDEILEKRGVRLDPGAVVYPGEDRTDEYQVRVEAFVLENENYTPAPSRGASLEVRVVLYRVVRLPGGVSARPRIRYQEEGEWRAFGYGDKTRVLFRIRPLVRQTVKQAAKRILELELETEEHPWRRFIDGGDLQ